MVATRLLLVLSDRFPRKNSRRHNRSVFSIVIYITEKFFLISSEKIEDEFERVQNEPFQKIFKLIFFSNLKSPSRFGCQY